MAYPLKFKKTTYKTDKRRKSDIVKKNKKTKGFTQEDCDWTMDGSKPIELPDLFLLENRR